MTERCPGTILRQFTAECPVWNERVAAVPAADPLRVPVAVPYVLGTYAMVTRTIIASDPVAVPYVLGTHAMVTGATIAYVPAAVPCVLGTRAEDT